MVFSKARYLDSSKVAAVKAEFAALQAVGIICSADGPGPPHCILFPNLMAADVLLVTTAS